MDEHNRFAAKLGPGEWRVWSAEHPERKPVDYDSGKKWGIMGETKTGHGWLNGAKESHPRWSELAEQFRKEKAMAGHCGFPFIIAIDNRGGYVAISKRFDPPYNTRFGLWIFFPEFHALEDFVSFYARNTIVCLVGCNGGQ